MRVKFWDRFLSALAGLLILAASVGLFCFAIGVLPVKVDLIEWEKGLLLWQRAIMVVVAVLLFLLGARCVSLLFRSRREKGFIMQHTEYGDLSISMTALENMVRKCIDAHEELKVNSTRIRHNHDSVIVELQIGLANGVNIPIAVNALQKQIKQYITSCSGVDVKEVRVTVETNMSNLPKPEAVGNEMLSQDVMAVARAGEVAESITESTQSSMPKPAEKQEEQPAMHQRNFKRGEE